MDVEGIMLKNIKSILPFQTQWICISSGFVTVEAFLYFVRYILGLLKGEIFLNTFPLSCAKWGFINSREH